MIICALKKGLIMNSNVAVHASPYVVLIERNWMVACKTIMGRTIFTIISSAFVAGSVSAVRMVSFQKFSIRYLLIKMVDCSFLFHNILSNTGFDPYFIRRRIDVRFSRRGMV
jgi:hypothetical protein